jgi:4-hydroxybutyryl-CoA dehydratase/vinylacetyl-CoA-Delta-isomerase
LFNRFTHIHQSSEDLVKKVKMLRASGQRTGSCFQRCVGVDALNAVYSTTFEMDQKLGTSYYQRFCHYLKFIQENDLMVSGSMTDVKGDRSKPPHQQEDPDMYVRVVKKNERGIILCGAKAHMTGMINSHEMLIMPTGALKSADQDYAVCCAVPVDASGVIHFFGRQTNDLRRLEGDIDQGNAQYGTVGGEALTILEDVFVPWERVFMCGEYEFAGMLVDRISKKATTINLRIKNGPELMVTGSPVFNDQKEVFIYLCPRYPTSIKEAGEMLERELLSKALTKGKSTRKVATLLGVDHSTVVRKMNKYQIVIK